MEIIAESEYRPAIPRQGRMRVPGVVFATRVLIPDPAADHALEQGVNVAELPGIHARSLGVRLARAPAIRWCRGLWPFEGT